MKPILLELGPLRIHGYGLALALAFLIGSLWVTRRARSYGFPEEELNKLFLYVLLSALIGSRIYYAFQHPEEFRDDWLEIFQVWRGGLTQYGGLLGALLVGWLFVRSRRWSFRAIADLLAPALALGEGIARIGCLLSGCCYGKPCALPWAIRYPEGSAAHWAFGNQALHPSPVYLMLGSFILFGVLAAFQRGRVGSGRVFALFLATSATLRFLVDMTRSYVSGDVLTLGGVRLAHSQWLGILLFALGVVFWIRAPRHEVVPPGEKPTAGVRPRGNGG